MNKLLFFGSLLLLLACQKKSDLVSLLSPDQKIGIEVILENGKPFFQVTCDDKTLLKRSTFSFEFKDQLAFDDSLIIADVTRSHFDETWKPVVGTTDQVRNCYHEMAITLKEYGKAGRSLILVVRAYNDGIAFRYRFPEDLRHNSLQITAEKSCFTFPANDSAWWIPANEFAYESLYRHTPISDIPDANTPITIQRSDGLFLSIHEAALVDYSEMTLVRSLDDTLTLVSSLWPEPDGVCASVKLPFQTPWRYILIGRKPGDLIESHLLQNLNDPNVIEDVSWIKPIKFVGIWWGMHTGRYTWFSGPAHGATTGRTKEYIDFAAAHHIGGVLAEGWNRGWETWQPGTKPVQDFCSPYPDFNLEEVVRYAREKNVAFILHHETGGNIPEYEKQMEQAFALCASLGIRYVKTGYAGGIIPEGYHHHGQFMVRHFQRVVETAARYKVALDVHESIKPTGLDRTWPNLMTQEAGRGNEWNATYKATPPYHAAILPFTRFLAGPFDFTPGIFRINHTPEKHKRLYCTLANQLAMYIVFYSPMMMVSDMIGNYQNSPPFSFIEEVPCTWDETKVIDAWPGDFITMARRSHDRWFVGSLGDENCYKIRIPLSFLKDGQSYEARIFGDSITTNWETNPEAVEIVNYSVTSSDTIDAVLSKAGGNVIIITPANPGKRKKLLPIKTYNAEADSKITAFTKIKTYGDHQVRHLARNKPVQLLNGYSSPYQASGNNALSDGERGTLNFSSGGWQGYEGVEVEATIDLQELKTIHLISAGFLNSPGDWIFFPDQVDFSFSRDGKNFIEAGSVKGSAPQPSGMGITETKDFSVTFKPVLTRYVRMKTRSIITCPIWHPGAGKKAWLFSDEIIVE